MNLVDAGLYGVLVGGAVAVAAAVVLRGRARNVIAGLSVMAVGALLPQRGWPRWLAW